LVLKSSTAECVKLQPLSVTKRDGSKAFFDSSKIGKAITKAIEASGEILVESQVQVLVSSVVKLLSSQPTIEEVQDKVEEVLMSEGFVRSARAYIIYREQRRFLRELNRNFNTNLVDSYLSIADWKVKENANMAYSLQGLNNHLAGELTKRYWLEVIYPQDIQKAHDEGDFHIHDLSLLATYCVGWDLADLLREGFRGVEGKIESNPAKHFKSALGQITNFFYTLQGESAGAQAFSSVDTLLAPFIARDKLTYHEVKQAVQEWVFNLNVATRVGFQTPFTNITLDVEVPSRMRDEPVVIGGVLQDSTYKDYQKEMDLFNRAFLEVMSEGDAKGRVFTFPIPTYNIAPGFNYDDPRYDLLWEVTAKYGIPYFANFVNSDMSPEDARSMCCRLRLDTRDLHRRGGGLFGANPLTGSIGVVTINLPRIGHLSSSKQDFLSRLDSILGKAKDSLILKRKTLEQFTDSGLYPYVKYYLRGIKEGTGRYWTNHFSTIGLVGMNEAIENLLGQGLLEGEGREFGLEVLERMRETILGFQAETGTLFNLEATPAEGTSYRLAKLDQKKYPEMRVPTCYTNSSQPPSSSISDPFELLENQDAFQTKYTGGTVIHFWLGEQVKDKELVKKFVRTVCSNYKLPYFTVTPTFSVCPEHGYLVGEQKVCPTCQVETEVYSRVVGYLRPVKQWNAGKQAEFLERASFDSGIK
jgi:ribonucleoside-triphosphate reductase